MGWLFSFEHVSWSYHYLLFKGMCGGVTKESTIKWFVLSLNKTTRVHKVSFGPGERES